jgi:uncharacterized protein involved in exopolysaccharide biosynthesis
LEGRRAELASQLENLDDSVRYSATTTDNPVFNEMRLEQARLEVERSGLLRKFTSQHQEVKAVDAKLAEVRVKLAEEKPKLLSSESTGLNDIRQAVHSNLLSVEAEIRTQRTKEQALTGTLAQEKASTMALAASEPRLAQITLQLTAAERAFQQVKEAYEEARLAESRTVTEVMVQHAAFPPTQPARPIKIVHVGTTFILSLFLAIGFAFLVSFFDSRVHGIEEAEAILGLPVLAAIPMNHSEASLVKR